MTIKSGMITVFIVRPDATGQSHEFLQLLRAPNVIHGQTWQIVRGKVEAGESFMAAALRELREETALVPRVFYRVGTVETFYTSIGDTIWHSVPCADRPRPAGHAELGTHRSALDPPRPD
jgi:dATP pyrophosphohydrolase